MDRNELIDRICAQGNQIRAVLQGLDTEHLQRISHWYKSRKGAFPMVAGEERPYNVYLIEWEDGTGYVGVTSHSIIQRMEHHFKNIHLGCANYEFFRRYEAGIGHRFHCLHTILEAREARRLEIQEIQTRNNLLNIAHNQNLLNRGKPSMRAYLRDRQRSVESEMRKAIKAGLRAGHPVADALISEMSLILALQDEI